MKTSAFIAFLLIVFAATSCGTSKKASGDSATKTYAKNGNPVPTKKSKDETYGYKEENPIRVGGGLMGGAANERKFLDALAGPEGESISYKRLGSCCMFETPNSSMGGLLDIYEITWKGQDEPVKLYLNMYDYEKPLIPVGFTKG